MFCSEVALKVMKVMTCIYFYGNCMKNPITAFDKNKFSTTERYF